jgi:hypothetical protein
LLWILFNCSSWDLIIILICEYPTCLNHLVCGALQCDVWKMYASNFFIRELFLTICTWHMYAVHLQEKGLV